jgi:hypothetical protein
MQLYNTDSLHSLPLPCFCSTHAVTELNPVSPGKLGSLVKGMLSDAVAVFTLGVDLHFGWVLSYLVPETSCPQNYLSV